MGLWEKLRCKNNNDSLIHDRRFLKQILFKKANGDFPGLKGLCQQRPYRIELVNKFGRPDIAVGVTVQDFVQAVRSAIAEGLSVFEAFDDVDYLVFYYEREGHDDKRSL
ncbi:MAG: hypothetical protein IJL92_08900 [Thermoguttaceae bacterium]|nr:hypothetical protein [Thermoguttaceae bacterium]